MHPWIPVKSPRGATLRQAAHICFQQPTRQTHKTMNGCEDQLKYLHPIAQRLCLKLKGRYLLSIHPHRHASTFPFSLLNGSKENQLDFSSPATQSWIHTLRGFFSLVTFIPALRHFKCCWFILPWIWMRVKPRSLVVPALQMGFYALAAGFLRAPTPPSFWNLFWVYFLLVLLILK